VTFWDTSALLSLLVGQSHGPELKRLVDEDPGLVLWWATRVELVFGVCRLRREELINEETFAALLRKIESITSEADQVEPTEQVRQGSVRILRVHSLRAADALQLASALVWAEYNPSSSRFVCLDKRLREAAEREGFTVLPAP
jgi:uncharacterized protein